MSYVEMSYKKSLVIVFRLTFTFFSLYFIKDAFYYWDGYSYYMRFADFLPDLSMAFILWSVLGVFSAVVLWLVLAVVITPLFKILNIRLEFIFAFCIFAILGFIIKSTLLSGIHIGALLGISRIVLVVVGVVFIALVFYFMRKSIDRIVDNVVYGINDRITPLVWAFLIAIIISIPLSFLDRPAADITGPEEGLRSAVSLNDPRPNILLIVMDTLTVLDMQLYGYDRDTTPFLTDWAKDAIVFKRAYSPSNWTSSSVMSLMTGQRLWTHGFWNISKKRAITNYYENFPRILMENGYDTYGFVQNRHAHPETLGIKNGFNLADEYYLFHQSSGWWFDSISERFFDRIIVKEWIFELNPIARLLLLFRPDNNVTLVPPGKVYDRFIDVISRREKDGNSDRPFFAWVHVYPPHDPYLPPDPYLGSFGDAGILNSEQKQLKSGFIESDYAPESQDMVDILRKRYDEFIAYSDRELELFMERLEDNIDLSNTIIIFLSDHGESFNHGYQGHSGNHLFQELVHVPLILKMPQQSGFSWNNYAPARVDVPVGLIDIAPTIFELAGLSIPEWMEGRSLKPFIDGKTLENEPVFSMQFINNRSLGDPIVNGTVAVWDGNYKLIHYIDDEKSLLFNLETDPGETIDIFEQESDKANQLLSLIKDNISKANSKIMMSH